MKTKPDWIIKYTDLNFSENWLDSVINEYGEDFIYRTTEDYSPLKFVNLRILNIESDININNHISIPKTYSFVTSLSFIYDMLINFSKNIPGQDDEIYELYTNISENSNFYSDYDFSEFYVFCQRLKYINIKQTKAYKIINKTKQSYIYDQYPISGSKWDIEYNGINMEVKIIDEIEEINNNIIDPYMIVTVLESESSEYINKELKLEPKYFNNGQMIV